MRKYLLLCSFALFLAGCAPTGDPGLRAREERPYPDPSLGTKNSESDWYSGQVIAAPSSTTPPDADAKAPAAMKAPAAKAPKSPIPATSAPAQ